MPSDPWQRGDVIFHVAERTRWDAAAAAGEYTESTRGRSLAEEGFVHLSTREQVAGVLERFYAEVPDLVLLHVDESRLTSPLRWEGGFPHLYGPLPVDAVVAVEALGG
jgi:glutathione S-transferase